MKYPLLNFGLSLLITGTLTFNNASSAVLDLLDAPGNEGMSNLFLYADSVPEGRSTVSPVQPAASLTSSSYAVTVDVDCTDPGGIPYRLSPVATVGNGRQYYFFNATTSAPVVANVAGPVVNFDECVGVVRLRFFESGGAPATVSKGRATCYRTGDLSQSAILFTIADGSGEQRIYLEGGQEHRL
jgi:hypothetical protein